MMKALEARGHECAVWGPDLPQPDGRFDVGVLANIRSTKIISALCGRIINVTHGIVDDERPMTGATVVSTSEEVMDRWECSGPVIRQPIDLKFWRPVKAERTEFVFYSYRAASSFDLEKTASFLGLPFRWLKDVTADEARHFLQRARFVCASGRSALEAMACGAPTLICDWRDYNGEPLCQPSVDEAMRFNYSGRGGRTPDIEKLSLLAKETMAFQNPRQYVSERHDANHIAEELLSLC